MTIATSFLGFLFSGILFGLVLPNWSELSQTAKNTSFSIPSWLLNLGICLSFIWLFLIIVFDSNEDEFFFRAIFHDKTVNVTLNTLKL